MTQQGYIEAEIHAGAQAVHMFHSHHAGPVLLLNTVVCTRVPRQT